MTDIELVEIATKYSLDYDRKYSEDFTFVDMIKRPKDFVDGSIEDMLNMIKKKTYRDGYIDAYKAGSQDKMIWHDYDAGEDCYEDTHEGRWVKRDNVVEWHNIKKNPCDLPTVDDFNPNKRFLCQCRLINGHIFPILLKFEDGLGFYDIDETTVYHDIISWADISDVCKKGQECF